jgi:hypothetical protein
MVPIKGSAGDEMISFALFVAIASQQMCLESPHRRECVAWASECLASAEDTPEGREAQFERCAEMIPEWVWRE